MKNLLLAFLTSLTACTGNSIKHPNKCPADFMLTYHLTNGRGYYSEVLHLSQDSCVFRKNDQGKKTNKHFTLSATELDELYSFLQEKQFDRIEYEFEKEVYDRGGISIDIAWDKGTKQIHISDAGRSFVKGKWQKNWNEICNRLLEIVAKNS